jgi:hypothetical protein
MTGVSQPLEQRQALVDPATGFPTMYFIQWAQQRQIDIGQGITAEQAQAIVAAYLASKPLLAGTGINLTPSGDINAGVTIFAEIQELLDEISTTHGTVLFRGAADWQALAPGTAGHFLQTGGPGADPVWAAGGGGGGGFTPLAMVQFTVDPGTLAVTIDKQTNVASVTRTGAGRYRITYATALADTFYSVQVSGRYANFTNNDTPNMGPNRNTTGGNNQYSTTQLDLYNSAGFDINTCSVLIYNAG